MKQDKLFSSDGWSVGDLLTIGGLQAKIKKFSSDNKRVQVTIFDGEGGNERWMDVGELPVKRIVDDTVNLEDLADGKNPVPTEDGGGELGGLLERIAALEAIVFAPADVGAAKPQVKEKPVWGIVTVYQDISSELDSGWSEAQLKADIQITTYLNTGWEILHITYQDDKRAVTLRRLVVEDVTPDDVCSVCGLFDAKHEVDGEWYCDIHSPSVIVLDEADASDKGEVCVRCGISDTK